MAVDGGALTVAVWGRRGPVVVAAHGITANHTCWAPLVRALGDGVRLAAPDLRGRGASNGVGPPFGMDAHADDLRAVLDDLDAATAVVVGHSMGGFVAAAFGAKYPDRVDATLLVDGGLPVPMPEGLTLDVDQALMAVIGPAMERLQRTFASWEEYQDFWAAHPAFADGLSDDVANYLAYDLAGAPPHLRSKTSVEAVRADAADTFEPDRVAEWLEQLGGPVTFLRAERGMFNQPGGLYPEAIAASATTIVPQLQTATIEGVNHYTIVLSDTGAAAVAGHVEDLRSRRRSEGGQPTS